jgi:hypothetical protein
MARDTYRYHVDRALELLDDVDRLPRWATGVKRVVVGAARVHAALAQAAATREAGDAIVHVLDKMGDRRRG